MPDGAPRLPVDPDLRFASLPPAEMYRGGPWWTALTEKVLARAWHVVATTDEVEAKDTALPVTLLEGALDEPLVLTRDRKERLHCLSNVCTHRGKVVATGGGPTKQLQCAYHGRTFALDGSFRAAPGFEGVPGFPGPSDDLRRLAVATWGPLVFASLDPDLPFEEWIAPLRDRLGWFDVAAARRDPAACRDHFVEAHWALYAENFLEGFHVPFVHAALARAIDAKDYRVETLPHGVLQVGVAREGEIAFDPPAGAEEHGQRVAAFWLWLFPTTMVNVYPWGISVNVLQPLGPARTRIRYLTFVTRDDLRGRGAGADLGRVEDEDASVVESVARGVRSRLWRPGRYSPANERGVHHFHRLLAGRLG